MMPANQIVLIDEYARLQFARQLYEKCLDRHGEQHEETRLVQQLVARLEARNQVGAIVQCSIPDHHNSSAIGRYCHSSRAGEGPGRGRTTGAIDP
jgi:hypothetical protein